jgi:hypothetical protein
VPSIILILEANHRLQTIIFEMAFFPAMWDISHEKVASSISSISPH